MELFAVLQYFGSNYAARSLSARLLSVCRGFKLKALYVNVNVKEKEVSNYHYSNLLINYGIKINLLLI